ncbi:hypothetical protein HYV86_06630 [Candidatus Woesearchaeota archaeon]|nr:hypothetical protein [Candidatus Woesearchaeota archaeon]
MKISFFEEFPTEQNLARLKFVSWKTTLYVAASSLQEFEKIVSGLKKNKHIEKAVYWPVLTKKEGYWISPFSKREALVRMLDELNGKQIPVMLDLELPTTRNSLLYVTQGLNFWRNKKLISNFIRNYNGEVSLCEYLPEGKKGMMILRWLGLHYEIDQRKNRAVMKMMYHSMLPFTHDFMHREMTRGVHEWGKRFVVGFGTIAVGVLGDEPVLDPKVLENDLILARDAGVAEVVIFRLGGLTKEYAAILKKFVMK